MLGTSRGFHGEIRNLSEGGTQIWLDEALHVSSLVKIERADKILLGEVVYCRQEQVGWLLGIRVGHTLSGVTDRADTKHRAR